MLVRQAIRSASSDTGCTLPAKTAATRPSKVSAPTGGARTRSMVGDSSEPAVLAEIPGGCRSPVPGRSRAEGTHPENPGRPVHAQGET